MAADPFTGVWRLNVAASTLPFAAPRSVVVAIEADQDNLSLTEHSTAADGRTETVTIRARFDDKVAPVDGSFLADGFAVRRIDEQTWKTRGFKNGQIAFTATLTLAGDGRSFREEAETSVEGALTPAVLVYERL